MPEVLAAPPAAVPSTDPFPVTGSAPARDARFGAVLRGWLRAAAPNDGDPVEASDAPACEPATNPALAMPWPLLIAVHTVSSAGTAHLPAEGTGPLLRRAGAAGAQAEGLGAAGAMPSADGGSPVPAGAAVPPHAGTPLAPGEVGPNAPWPTEAAGGTRPPTHPHSPPTPFPSLKGGVGGRWGWGVGGVSEDGAPAAPLPTQRGFEGQPPPSTEPAQPNHPAPRAGWDATADGDPTPAALLRSHGAGEGVTEHGTATDTGRPAAVPRHVSAGPATGQEPLPAAALLAPNAIEGEGGGERHTAEGEDSAAIPLPPASASIAPGGLDSADTAVPTGATSPAPAATWTAMAPADAPRTPVVAQVAAALALSARDGAAEVTMTLRPPELGEVRARIVAGPDGLVIRLSAEREAVGALLRARAGELHQALLVQQVPVAEVHVLHNPPPTPSATAPDWQGWQEQLWLRREPGQQERRPGQEGAYQEADDEA